jgi:hypothetical protein
MKYTKFFYRCIRMTMDKVTSEEEKAIMALRDEMLDEAFKFKFNEEKMKEFCAFCYKICGLKGPPMIVVDSPEAAQVIGNILLPMAKAPPNFNDYQTKSLDELKKQLTSKTDYVCFCWRDFSDWGWIAYYEYFTRTGELKNENFNTYARLMKESGIFVWVAMDEAAIIVRPPYYMDLQKRDNNRANDRLHSITRPAMEFRDGMKYYFVNGRPFKPEVWNQFFPGKKALASDILKVSNTEERTAIIDAYGMEYVIDNLKANVLDKQIQYSKQHQCEISCELLEFDYNGRRKIALKMTCPSKLDTHVHLINQPTCKTVDEAFAWKNNMTLEEYKHLKLTYES